ncbi:SURF1 family protein [Corallincola holothuriorum]|uniref:SURF1-like protein n=1 Tax=Corallincola holothuriorum TaxID=2282215 RepID=A0A368NMN4_9GAMM|nr:SURF1 family protein [Corallincola holothuriorum]RCU51115.1 SURF1 family protein [Corallincola holothuriorum]
MMQFDLPGGGYQLQLSWWVLLLAILLAALLLRLGFWQLSRAEFKQSLIATAEKSVEAGARPLDSFANDADMVGQTVKISGRFLLDQVILLDNQIWQKRVGYQVVLPLQLAHSSQIQLVNIGFVPASLQRAELPELDLAAVGLHGEQSIQGRIKSLQQQVMVLSQQTIAQHPNWPLRLQTLDIAALQPLFTNPLRSDLLLLDQQLPIGYPREWPVTTVSVEKHQAYAFQWFSMALVFIAIMLSVGVTKTARESHES